MLHVDSKKQYEQFVESVAERERELAAGATSGTDCLPESYEGYEEPSSIAATVVGAPTTVDSTPTMRHNGYPYVTDRICPVSVFIHSDQIDAVEIPVTDESNLHQAAVSMFSADLLSELTAE